jgi:dihydroneopterin aldolase
VDIVYLRDLRIPAVIGVFEWERRVRQVIAIDLDMACDVARAARTDALADALDYKAVAKRLIGFVEESRFQLVETLAERIAELVRQEFQVGWIRVRINKTGAVRGARDVGVIIERGRRPFPAASEGHDSD